jgi:hypothetical protein
MTLEIDLSVPVLSGRRGSCVAGAPARPRTRYSIDIGRHPADVAADGHERRTVFALRGRGVSWAHVARQVGRPEVSLRRLYDPAFAAALAAPPADRSTDPLPPARIGPPPKGDIAWALAAIGPAGMTTADLADRLGRRVDALTARLERAMDRGLVTIDARKRPRRWVLTEAGRARVAQIPTGARR